MEVFYVIGWLFSILVAFVFVVWITLRKEKPYDLNQESEDLINNNKQK